jgi:hypothetical protein
LAKADRYCCSLKRHIQWKNTQSKRGQKWQTTITKDFTIICHFPIPVDKADCFTRPDRDLHSRISSALAPAVFGVIQKLFFRKNLAGYDFCLDGLSLLFCRNNPWLELVGGIEEKRMTLDPYHLGLKRSSEKEIGLCGYSDDF